MATVTGLTAGKMLELADANIVGANVVGNNLILTRRNGTTFNAGSVQGPQGIQGPIGQVSNADLAAAVATINATISTNAAAAEGKRQHVLGVVERTEDQAVVTGAQGEFVNLSGFTWTHNVVGGRYLQVSFQIMIFQEDSTDPVAVAARVNRSDAEAICGSFAPYLKAWGALYVIGGTRTLLVPDGWTGSQTFRLQLARLTPGIAVTVKHSVLTGSMSFIDLGPA